MSYLAYFIFLLCAKLTLCGVQHRLRKFPEQIDKSSVQIDKNFQKDMLSTFEAFLDTKPSVKNCTNFPISNLTALGSDCDNTRAPKLKAKNSERLNVRLMTLNYMCFSAIYNMFSLCYDQGFSSVSKSIPNSVEDIVSKPASNFCDTANSVVMKQNCTENNTYDQNDLDGCKVVKKVTEYSFQEEQCKGLCIDDIDNSVRPVCQYLYHSMNVINDILDHPNDAVAGQINSQAVDKNLVAKSTAAESDSKPIFEAPTAQTKQSSAGNRKPLGKTLLVQQPKDVDGKSEKGNSSIVTTSAIEDSKNDGTNIQMTDNVNETDEKTNSHADETPSQLDGKDKEEIKPDIADNHEAESIPIQNETTKEVNGFGEKNLTTSGNMSNSSTNEFGGKNLTASGNMSNSSTTAFESGIPPSENMSSTVQDMSSSSSFSPYSNQDNSLEEENGKENGLEQQPDGKGDNQSQDKEMDPEKKGDNIQIEELDDENTTENSKKDGIDDGVEYELKHDRTTERGPQELMYENTFSKGVKHLDDGSSNFFGYFMFLSIVAIAAYLVFHNKQKILALILEGRRRQSSRRRMDGKEYRRVDTNLEDTMTSRDDVSGRHVIY